MTEDKDGGVMAERSTPASQCPQCAGGIVGPDPVYEGRTLTWRNVGSSRQSFTERSCTHSWHDEIEAKPAPTEKGSSRV